MSYCRWSSDNWKCDLYCYADVSGGYTTHVAGRKRVGHIPDVPDILTTPSDEWTKAYKTQMAALKSTKLIDIGLPYDGMSFNDDDLESFLDRVNCLKEAGYRVPMYVLEDIEEEIEEGIA